MLRPCALLCFVAGLAGLIWMGPGVYWILFGDFDLMSDIMNDMPWWWRLLYWLSDRDLERELEPQVADAENEIMVYVWGITILSIGLCVLGVFLWRKSRHRQKVQAASVSL